MLVTRPLIDRLETSAALACERAVASMSGAETTPFGRGLLVAMGEGRYVNRAMGVTIDELDDESVGDLVAWYRDRGLPPMLEVSAWASRETLAALAGRGFAPSWFRAMFARTCDPSTDVPASDVDVFAVSSDDDAATWRRVFAAGFGVVEPDAIAISDEYAAADRAIESGQQFLAVVAGEVAGCGGVVIADGVAWVGGAATLPQFRGRGVQAALVRRRLQHGQEHGCDLAAATAVPIGDSARNLTRLGFHLVQHQVVMSVTTGGR